MAKQSQMPIAFSWNDNGTIKIVKVRFLTHNFGLAFITRAIKLENEIK